MFDYAKQLNTTLFNKLVDENNIDLSISIGGDDNSSLI
jgi:hypothetical protein